jgi:nitroimidazol reductase NimA-like FMN-containing flavoprotein (pyridoxamine 5'-phosphate oxidase superfamily)
MGAADQPEKTLRELLDRQPLAVLATHCSGQPHASLVGFWATDDLKHVVFATPKPTRKYNNLQADGRVAMLIDNRSHRVADFKTAAAVTVVGRVREIKRKRRSRFAAGYVRKHPHLEEFLAAPTCALLVVDVERYSMVTRFQDVIDFDLSKGTAVASRRVAR